jgi:membrane protease YdiL (CAAX protease family)
MNLDPIDLDAAPPVESARLASRLSLGRALAALCAGFLLAQLFGKLAADVARAITHADASPTSGPVVVASMLASELALLSVAVVTPLLSSLPLRQALGLASAKPRVFAAATLGTVMLGPLGDRLMTLFSTLFPNLTLGVVPALRDLAQHLPLLWLWPTFALLPGLAEELLFRGVLQHAIARPGLAIVLSGGAFALFHVDPVHVMGVLPLGLFLAWVAQRSSTSVTIAAHVLNNSVALIGIRSSALDVGYGSERELPWPWLAVSLGLFVVACVTIAHDTAAPRSLDSRYAQP